MRFFNSWAILALTLMLATGTVSAAIDAEQALAIAWQAAIDHDPALNSTSTKVSHCTTDQVVVLNLSDPFALNGEVFWRTYDYYEYTNIPVSHRSSLGTRAIDSAAPAPQIAGVPDGLKDVVIAWLSFWDSQASLDPDLRVGARRTRVFLYRFRQGLMGPQFIIGVDADGTKFRPNLDSPIFPWGYKGSPLPAEHRFERLHEVKP